MADMQQQPGANPTILDMIGQLLTNRTPPTPPNTPGRHMQDIFGQPQPTEGGAFRQLQQQQQLPPGAPLGPVGAQPAPNGNAIQQALGSLFGGR